MLLNSHYLDKSAIPSLSEGIAKHFAKQPPRSEIIVVCIGSNRYLSDALGPMVGDRLSGRFDGDSRIQVLGSSHKPVHALNIGRTALHLESVRDRAYVIAVDASLGQLYKIGTLQLVGEPLQPGAAMGKSLPPIGDIHIKGIVNNHAPLNPAILENPSLNFLEPMALVISRILIRSVQSIAPGLHALSQPELHADPKPRSSLSRRLPGR